MWQDMVDSFSKKGSYGRRALLGGGPSQRGPIGCLSARDHGLHRSWIYELLARDR
jgi:hypothetical protein